MIYLPKEVSHQVGDHLWEEDEYKDHNRREPQKSGAYFAGPAIALFGPPGFVKTKRNEQYRKDKQVWSQFAHKSRYTCCSGRKQKGHERQAAT